MKSVLWILVLSLSTASIGQPKTLLDKRDNQTYEVGEVNGHFWMLDNLNLKTELSFGLNEEQQALYPNLNGRWYHLSNLESICPDGWHLPTADDWLGYFDLLSEMSDASPQFKQKKEGISIHKFSKHFDLFEPGNPLRIIPTGIFQGTNFIIGPGRAADYWIQDLPVKNKGDKDHTHMGVRVLYPGTSHIHLFNGFSQIHSHDHHLDPLDQETIRRFLVRCICEDED